MREVNFPPQLPSDIAAYGADEVMAGFVEYRTGDPAPGENRSPAYRWGWMNARRDRSASDDGFDAVRHAYLRARRALSDQQVKL